jgi:hypothetical protein
MAWYKTLTLGNLLLLIISSFWPIGGTSTLLSRDRISFYSQSRAVAWLVNGAAGQTAVDNAVILEAYAEAVRQGVATDQDYQLCKQAEDAAILYKLSAITKYQQAVVAHLGFDALHPQQSNCPRTPTDSRQAPINQQYFNQKPIAYQII